MKITRRSMILALSCGVPPGWADSDITDICALRPSGKNLGEAAVLDAVENRAKQVLAAINHPANLTEASQRRGPLRRSLRNSLGLDRLPWPPRLAARTVGVVRESGYQIEKIIYETLPGVRVPAHLYGPANSERNLPAVIFYPGHWWEDSKTRPSFQAFCINMARFGFLVLAFDPFGQGERGVSTRDHRRTELLGAGVSQQGIAEYETQCALHYLLSRPEVDARRIGFTGASGGGYNTWMTAALDNRISVAVPVVGTSDFYEQIHVCRPLDWYHAIEHCHFVPNLIRYANNHELLAMVAPRPLLIIAAAHDQSFPVDGVRRVHRYGQRLYETAGKREKIGLYVDATAPHGYQRRKREAAYGWFLRWLMGKGTGSPHPEPPTRTRPWNDPGLRCFPPGRNQPAGPGMVAMAEKLARATRPAAGAWNLESVLGAVSRRAAPALSISKARLQRFLIPREEGISLPGFLLRPSGTVRGLAVAAADSGKEELAEEPILREALAHGWAIAGLDVRGIGELAVTKMGWVFAVSLLLGENFVWRQALDLVAAVLALVRQPEFVTKPVGLYTRGHNASLASVYAVARLRQQGRSAAWFVQSDGFLSFRQFIDRPISSRLSFRLQTGARYRYAAYDREIPSQYFVFDVLRHFDLPQLLEQAETPGLMVNPINGDWERMEEVEARRILPASIGLACLAEPPAAVAAFRPLLARRGA